MGAHTPRPWPSSWSLSPACLRYFLAKLLSLPERVTHARCAPKLLLCPSCPAHLHGTQSLPAPDTTAALWFEPPWPPWPLRGLPGPQGGIWLESEPCFFPSRLTSRGSISDQMAASSLTRGRIPPSAPRPPPRLSSASSLPLPRLPPQWPPCCSSGLAGSLLPQGLCTSCALSRPSPRHPHLHLHKGEPPSARPRPRSHCPTRWVGACCLCCLLPLSAGRSAAWRQRLWCLVPTPIAGLACMRCSRKICWTSK